MLTFFKWFGILLGTAILALAAGCVIPRPLFQSDVVGEKSAEILVITNPIHTDIAIPATPETLAEFAFLADSGMPLDNPNVQWIMFGWGGRAFYLETPTWADLKFVPVLKGLTADASALHIEPLGNVDRSNPNVASFKITEAGLEAMRQEMLNTFQHDMKDRPELIAGKSYGEYDQFYEAKGTFNALVGCNTWAAKMLRYAGLQTGWWNPFPQSLRFSLNLQN